MDWWSKNISEVNWKNALDISYPAWGSSLEGAYNEKRGVQDSLHYSLSDELEKSVHSDYGIDQMLEHIEMNECVSEDEMDDVMEGCGSYEDVYEEITGDSFQEYVNEKVRFELECHWEDDDHEGDIEFALCPLYLRIADRLKASPWYHLALRASAANQYHLGDQYMKMGVAQIIAPDSIIVDQYDEVNFDDILGLCEHCYRPLWYGNLFDTLELPMCCDDDIDLRRCRLIWLFFQGLLTDPLEVVLDPKNAWIIWPAEIEHPFSKTKFNG